MVLMTTANGKQVQMPVMMTNSQNVAPPAGFHSVQNNETGKIYHLAKNTDGTGNHCLISTKNYNTAAGSYGNVFSG